MHGHYRTGRNGPQEQRGPFATKLSHIDLAKRPHAIAGNFSSHGPVAARNLSAGARIELAGWIVLSDDKVPRESRSRAGLLEGLERGDGLEWLAVLERLELLGVRPSVG